MVTRSQATAKRKAEDSNFEPPAKSSKSSSSDDSSTRRRRKPTAKKKSGTARGSDSNIDSTKSKASAKRKAGEAGPEAPAKQSKSSSSDDSSTNRRKAEAAKGRKKKPVKTRKNGGNGKGKALSSISEEPSAPVASGASQSWNEEFSDHPEDGVSQGMDKDHPAESPNDGPDQTMDQRGSQRQDSREQLANEPPRATDEGGPTEKQAHYADPAADEHLQDQEVKDRDFARTIFQQLQLLVEQWRVDEDNSMPSVYTESELEGLTELCELAATYESPQSNEYLKTLPREWWQDLKKLHERLKQLRTLQETSSSAEKEFDDYCKVYRQVVAKRGETYLGLSDHSRESRRLLRAEVVTAREAWRSAFDNWQQASTKYTGARDDIWRHVSHVLSTAENMLVFEGYLRRWDFEERLSIRVSQLEAEDADARQDQESLHTPVHSPFRSHSGIDDYENTPYGLQHPVPDPTTPARGADIPPGDQPNGRPDAVESFVGNVQKRLQRNWLRAQDSYDKFLERFDAVRKDYDKNLVAFVDKQRRNAIRGTRTDFDHDYYLERREANHNVALAQKELEFAYDQAEATGALNGSARPLSDDSLAPNERAGVEREREAHPTVRMLLDLQTERVETWRQAVADAEVASEAHWADMVENVRWEGKSLESSVQEPEEEDRLSSGERRKQIDDWRKEQERVRRENAFAVLPSTFVPLGAEVRWFEGWNGL